jgi:hypothetical protein
MSLDLDNSWNEGARKLKALKTYGTVISDYKKLKQETANNLEQPKQDTTSTLGSAKDAKKRFQKEVKNQFEKLLDFTQSGIDDIKSGVNETKSSIAQKTRSKSSTVNFIKLKMVQSLRKIEPDVKKILFQEILHAVGCSHDQNYVSKPVYVRIQSIDLYEKLKLSPDDPAGKTLFEKRPISVGNYPFSMNKELYNRVQNLNQSFSATAGVNYKGKSGQDLFDIKYVKVNNLGETGDFFEITLTDRYSLNDLTNPTNKVGDFLQDYYATIQLVDFTNIFSNLIEALTGMVSISVNIGSEKLDDQSKFGLLIQRVLGLCFDSKSEIDVSGVAKIAELDGFDDSFFEFTEIDLRNIDQQSTNIKNGVAEFENCGDVKVPINWSQLLNAVDQLNFIEDEADLDEAASNLPNVITDNPEWALLFPNSVDIKATINTNFIKELPKAFITTLLSPKILLPIFIVLESIQQLASSATNLICKSTINSLQDFFKCFKSFVTNLVSKIGSLFVKELFELIKKDLINLVQSIIIDIKKEKLAKKYAIILTLVQLTIAIAQIINDYRKCKSLIDEILALLRIVTSGLGNKIPLPLLALSELLGGTSPTSAMINVIEEMQRVGLPTGPMPDGSPNLFLTASLSQLIGQDRENSENGTVQIFAKPLAISPAGFTIPASLHGKSF